MLFFAAGCSGGDTPESSSAAAQWVLQIGGKLHVAGKTQEMKSSGDLPAEPFRIEKITLNDTKVKDDDLEKLAGLKSLRSLSLYRTDVGDNALAHVAAIPNLEELELSYTRVTDQGLPRLKDLRRLNKLYLYGTNATVTDDGVKSLQQERPKLKIYR